MGKKKYIFAKEDISSMCELEKYSMIFETKGSLIFLRNYKIIRKIYLQVPEKIRTSLDYNIINN